MKKLITLIVLPFILFSQENNIESIILKIKILMLIIMAVKILMKH